MGLFKHFRSRPGLNTALGAAFAIIAGMMLLGFFARSMKGEPGGKLVSITVARRDIALGSPITGDMLATHKIPSGYTVPGTLRDASEITGSRALRFIGKGEPIISTAIAGGKGAGNLASKIPADLRAYSVQLTRGSAGSGDLRPGDRVDVLSTSGEPPRTGTLLTSRLILSVGTSTDASGDGVQAGAFQSITLLVAPREAELLAQASCSGEISVSLCPVTGAVGNQAQGGK